MADIQVAVMNESTVLSDDAVIRTIPALQIQVHNHFAPAWGIDADLTFVPQGSALPSGAWWLTISDDSDRAEYLGYHELTDEGRPTSKVFARSDQTRGYQWTVTASHELLEMLADPNAQLAVLVQPQAYASFLYAYEVCDPCESEAFAYTIPEPGGDVLVSDFVFPAWFEPLRDIGSTRFDYGGYLQAPLQCLPGSHMDVFDINCGIWRHFRGEGQPYRYEPKPLFGTRREQRRRPLNRWRRSQILRARTREHGRVPDSDLVSQTLNQLSSSLEGLRATISRLE